MTIKFNPNDVLDITRPGREDELSIDRASYKNYKRNLQGTNERVFLSIDTADPDVTTVFELTETEALAVAHYILTKIAESRTAT